MNRTSVVGIDCRDGRLYLARVVHGGGRPEVDSLSTLSRDEISEGCIRDGDRLILSVPDNMVLVKALHLDRTDPVALDRRVYFELGRSVLEPETEFLFDALIPEDLPLQLGLIYRRERLRDLLAECGCSGQDNVGYLVRAAALGRGYLTFCRPASGELVALVDIAPSLVSICILYRRRLVCLAHLADSAGRQATDETINKLAIECRTIVNFKLAALADVGITLPLSSVVLSGADAGERVRDVFSRRFSACVSGPEINRAFFTESTAGADVDPEQYLVALGLAVN
ncbi:MAG TPA: hypothetical protein VMY05_06090 [Acidobacteriota bacterium]|nr:hypothetical protein [Acidobacteriota bacterium]